MARFTRIALGSAYELHTLLTLSARLALADEAATAPLLAQLEQLNRRLSRFIQYHTDSA